MEQEILDLTYQSCDAFKNQPSFLRLKELTEHFEHDQAIKDLIEQFKKAKTKYEEAKQYGQYHPDLQRIQKAFLQSKIDMMSHDLVKEYKQLENELQKQLDQLSIDLAECVSSHIKHPKEYMLLK